MIYIYIFIATLLALVFAPLFAVWSLLTGKKRRGLWHHFGIVPKLPDRRTTLWLYALSMGEVTAAAPVLKHVRKERPDIRIVISVTTDSGYETAHKQLGFADLIIYHPFDCLPFLVLALNRIRPDIFIVTETGFWPGLLHMLYQRNIPALLFQGRISKKSMRRYQLLKPVFSEMLNSFRALCMQNAQGMEDMALFAPSRLQVVGDTKYDALRTVSPEEQALMRDALRIPDGCPVIVAGSTHEGEEEIILEAFQKLKADHPNLVLILVPRRLERVFGIVALLNRMGIPFIQRSRATGREDVILLDTMGELFTVYALCDVALVGRSLIPPGGGHSLIEPASLGKVVLHGPYMEHNQTVADELGSAGVAITVHDAGELEKRIRDLLSNPSRRASLSQKARVLMEAKKGASKRMAEIIFETLGNREGS